MGFQIYVTTCGGLPEDKKIKQERFHAFKDTHFAFELEDGGEMHLKSSDIHAIAWAAVGGFFKAEAIHAVIAFNPGITINFLLSESGLGAVGESGIALPQIDSKTGKMWDQSYKRRVKHGGAAWKTNLLNRLGS